MCVSAAVRPLTYHLWWPVYWLQQPKERRRNRNILEQQSIHAVIQCEPWPRPPRNETSAGRRREITAQDFYLYCLETLCTLQSLQHTRAKTGPPQGQDNSVPTETSHLFRNRTQHLRLEKTGHLKTVTYVSWRRSLVWEGCQGIHSHLAEVVDWDVLSAVSDAVHPNVHTDTWWPIIMWPCRPEGSSHKQPC